MPGKKSTIKLALKPLKELWTGEATDYITELQWSPDELTFACADANGNISIFDSSTGTIKKSWHAHKLGALRARWSTSGKYFATAGQDGKAKIYNGRTLEPQMELYHGIDWVEHLVWNAKEDIFLTAAGRTLRLWNSDGTLIREFARQQNTIADVVWNPAMPSLFATSGYNGAKLWSMDKQEPKRALKWKGSLLNIAYSPNNKVLAGGCQDGAAHIWLLPSGEDLFMNGYPTKVRELSWDKTSRYLATGGGAEAVIWDFSGKGPQGSTPLMLPGHENFISTLSFCPTDFRLATGGLDGKIIIRNIANPEEPASSAVSDSDVSAMTWNKSGEQIIAGFASGKLSIFVV